MSVIQTISIGAKIKEVGRHSIIYGLGSVSQSAAGLILLPILTGSLSKDDFGTYSLILMVAGIASSVFYFGMASALPRSYFDYESADDRRAVFTTAFLIMLAGAFLQACFAYYFAENISHYLVGSNERADAIVAALIGGALGFINTFFFSYLRLLRKSISSVIFSVISLVGTVGVTFYFLALFADKIMAPFKAIIFTQAGIALIFALIYGKSIFSLRIKSIEIPKLLHFGIASIVASFGAMLIESLDRLMIQHYMTLADVGTYSAAFRVAMLINVILILPFSQIWSPMMMEYRNKVNIKDLFTHVFSLFMILGGIIVIVSSLFAQEFLPLLIRSGVDSDLITVFLISMIGLLIYGVTGFVGAGLFYERKVHLLSYAYYGSAFLKAIIGFILIPSIGLIGASISAICAYSTVPLVIYTMSKSYFSFRVEWRRLGIFFIISLPALIYGFFGNSLYEVDVIVRLVWLGFTLVLIYLKCFSANERMAAKKIFRSLAI
jgi:O-antigen/teichoic acid export membrane protein